MDEPHGVVVMTTDLRYGHPMRVDLEADMAYIEVNRFGQYIATDPTHEDDGVLVDYDNDGNVLGIELFLRDGQVRPESDAVVRGLLGLS